MLRNHSGALGGLPRPGTKQVKMHWTREGSWFPLLLEQATMTLVRGEMPVLVATARIIGVNDTHLWRAVQLYVPQALSTMDLSGAKAVALDKTASPPPRGHNYITVFIDLDRKQKPVIFVTPGKSKGYLVLFRRFLRGHGGDHNNIAEVVCDMSPAFLAAIGLHPPCPEVHSA
ncbi:hypothetical protein DFAR_3460063 [Desulfarculales bacterium]